MFKNFQFIQSIKGTSNLLLLSQNANIYRIFFTQNQTLSAIKSLSIGVEIYKALLNPQDNRLILITRNYQVIEVLYTNISELENGLI